MGTPECDSLAGSSLLDYHTMRAIKTLVLLSLFILLGEVSGGRRKNITLNDWEKACSEETRPKARGACGYGCSSVTGKWSVRCHSSVPRGPCPTLLLIISLQMFIKFRTSSFNPELF